MTTALLDHPPRIVAMCDGSGVVKEVPLTQDEIDQRIAAAAAFAQQQTDQLAADQLQATKLAAVNAKLALINLTPDDLITLGLQFKKL